jgi:hypothetical protein
MTFGGELWVELRVKLAEYQGIMMEAKNNNNNNGDGVSTMVV